MNFIW